MADSASNDSGRSINPANDSLHGEYHILASQSSLRKAALLFVFCFAQFLDTFNNSALFAAIPPISADLKIVNSVAVWLISAYQLTFAALLLVSGRFSDLYDPKIVFLVGSVPMGAFALGAGFVRHQVPLIVLRALMGVGNDIVTGASLTIPSALHLIVHMYPDPAAQAKAIAAFGGSAAIGNVIGLIIGSLLVTYVSWPWVFYFIAIVALFISISVLVLVPAVQRPHLSVMEKAKRFRRLDLGGVSVLTIALILFIFAVTSGSVDGWRTGRAIAPLIISVFMAVGFFVWESMIPEDMAAIPPGMWFYTNFSILTATALLPFMWWGSVQFLFSWLWQEVYGWSTIITAVHFLPLGLVSIPFMAASGFLQQLFPLKYVIIVGQLIAIAGTALFPFADTPPHYWRFAFPGMCLGTAGVTVVFATVNIAIFAVTPPKVAGMVGAIFNCSLQLGCAAGVAIITSIQTSIEKTHGGAGDYRGRAAGFWFLFAFTCFGMLAVLVFMKNTLPPLKQKAAAAEENQIQAKVANGGELKKEQDSDQP
ncbi:hypothetical protein AMATHDRAFT_4276 [Amanita thiersii Skay4041]|uniref:Major facilitator superfamily (MFS) profile domain-containing protein n=1 Tax=Amanita thiersii Skay4041 TaxID=703135 RepID=A0A2A9NPD0_9AGAR|nr:hypothetical protein AMATHDRAFT_4276 [Amanita thiersii Skay4041]